MTTIVIATSTIAAEKVIAISYCAGTLLVDVGTSDPLSWKDPDRALFCKVLRDWKDYLQNRESLWRNSIEYAVGSAAGRQA